MFPWKGILKKHVLISVSLFCILLFSNSLVYGQWPSAILPSVSLDWALYGIHFTSPDEGWAVGVDDVNHAGVLLHYSEGIWTLVNVPPVSPSWGLYGVHFISPDEGWAVGIDDVNHTGVLLEYSNDSWTSLSPASEAQVGASPPVSPKISVSPSSVNFGNVNSGNDVERTVAIQNKGRSNLVISSINISGADFSQTNNCTTVTPGNSCAATVTFAPPSIGKKSAILSISSNDPRKPTINVKLSGKGISSDCTYNISPTSRTFGVSGGSGSVDVAAKSECAWTATSNANWITITSGGTGSGNGAVAYTVGTNTGTSQRTGTMTIAGKTFTVTQEGNCTYSISPTNNTFLSGPGEGTINVTAPDGCPWTAASNNVTWITIISGASGSGNGTVHYSVADNSISSVSRTGTITIEGQVFTVTQFGSTVPALTITARGSDPCRVNQSCTRTVATVTGGEPPYGYYYGSLAYGTRPWGMNVDVMDTANHQNAVVVSGTPTQAGSYSFQVCVHDLRAIEKCTIASLSINSAPTGQCNSSGDDQCIPTITCAGCSIDSCAAISGENVSGYYKTSDGHYFCCSGTDCSAAAQNALQHCGCI